jgi:hypothetical protein
MFYFQFKIYSFTESSELICCYGALRNLKNPLLVTGRNPEISEGFLFYGNNKGTF